MNIKSMLLRLQGALGRDDLSEMVLLAGSAATAVDWAQSQQGINLVVGYNGSPQSQTALDLTLWMAHQTRLVTRKPVTVQVVYVVDSSSRSCPDSFSLADVSSKRFSPITVTSTQIFEPQDSSVAASTLLSTVPFVLPTPTNWSDPFEQADHILWQARCLADEWRGSLKAHLRFGCVATELRNLVESEAAALLCLGCHTATHPVIQRLGSAFPCPVLGIPSLTSSTVVDAPMQVS